MAASSADDYISQHDSVEVKRMADLAAGAGLGDTIYAESDDVDDMMRDFGFELVEKAEKEK